MMCEVLRRTIQKIRIKCEQNTAVVHCGGVRVGVEFCRRSLYVVLGFVTCVLLKRLVKTEGKYKLTDYEMQVSLRQSFVPW